MSNIDLFSSEELPVGFSCPRQFEHIVELSLLDLEPWYVLHGKGASRYEGRFGATLSHDAANRAGRFSGLE